ncbi:hypothetical protein SBV1_1760007 [Verrucomicrobia bacterium]|nr:hypothetical protein SBV1_1760007 [Verrucomicrobiota bacterium]
MKWARCRVGGDGAEVTSPLQAPIANNTLLANSRTLAMFGPEIPVCEPSRKPLARGM